MKDIRLHDLRHCSATGTAALGIPREIRERLQNQVTGRRQSVGARYDQHEYLAEKRDEALLTLVANRHESGAEVYAALAWQRQGP
jgi:hypothetical protein